MARKIHRKVIRKINFCSIYSTISRSFINTVNWNTHSILLPREKLCNCSDCYLIHTNPANCNISSVKSRFPVSLETGNDFYPCP